MQNSISVVSSVLPFPPIYWWQQVIRAGEVIFDEAEHFEKMSYRNRYYVATANGKHCLSIPVLNGREQRAAMRYVKIANNENWRQLHWRTLFSAYNRSPYFEFYKDDLESLFFRDYDKLIDFNIESIHWVKKQLKLNFEETVAAQYQKEYNDAKDVRYIKPQELISHTHKNYNQVFADRTGFLPQLSILDLLFNEGRYAIEYLKS